MAFLPVLFTGVTRVANGYAAIVRNFVLALQHRNITTESVADNLVTG